jgi:hypothetical protein
MFDKFLIEMGKVTIPSKAEFAKFLVLSDMTSKIWADFAND